MMDKRSKWQGKKVNFLGDSITCGYGTTKIYHEIIKSKIGLEVARNYGINATRIASCAHDEDNSMSVRFSKMEDDADLIIVFAVTNDFGHDLSPIGEFGDRSTSTFHGACHVLMRGLIEKCYDKTIAFITSLHREFHEDVYYEENASGNGLEQYVNIIKEVTRFHSLPVLDLYSVSGMQPKVPIIKELYIPDGLHPNEAGHERLAEKITTFMETL
ncbi:SGNH/GDSL hydrolase family protein [Clostridium sp.]|uniref:SGNH/GDSL hydrolase family protein n=1 Tax=Clostridium sp. TaxID=1506 RepID=UPI002638D16D|nr:SGNH/GDSL hydrolase family protein [uncultured Clostridium sp.]